MQYGSLPGLELLIFQITIYRYALFGLIRSHFKGSSLVFFYSEIVFMPMHWL